MAQTRLITDLVSLVTPSNDDVLVIVDNTTNPSLSETKKISYANLRENLQDMIDVLISGDTTITSTYDDTSNLITLSVNNNTTTQKSIISNSGTTVGTRQELNVVPGAGMTINGVDDSLSDRVSLTLATTAVSTASGLAGSGATFSTLNQVATLGDGTKSVNLRALKAGSSKVTMALADSNESIVVDIDPSQININDVSSATPLAISRGGTGASNAANARVNIGAAAAGANNDITSITGLTTPLTVAQGGSGASTAATGLFNLGGLRVIENSGAVGESLIVSSSQNVSGEYRGQLKSIRPASSKTIVSTVNNEITVDVNPDNVLAAATQNVNFNGFRLTNLAAPLADSDAATKAYADGVAQGLTVKEASRAATVSPFVATYFDDTELVTAVTVGTDTLTSANHVFSTGDRVKITSDGAIPGGLIGGTTYFVIDVDSDNFKLAATASDAAGGSAVNITDTGSGTITVAHTLYLVAGSNGALSIDGVTLVQGDRVLLQDQTTATQNGIYVVSETGDVTSPAVLTRADDFNASAEMSSGSFTFVQEGNNNNSVAFVQITQDPILDVSDIVFTPFSTGNIPDNTVTNTKLADVAEATIKGRAVGTGTGDPIDLTANQTVAIISTATDPIDCGTY
tara:strand:+ start:1971 stop:3860 length:1890 start_codon:yes stop_codon:yes gene_type:complete